MRKKPGPRQNVILSVPWRGPPLYVEETWPQPERHPERSEGSLLDPAEILPLGMQGLRTAFRMTCLSVLVSFLGAPAKNLFCAQTRSFTAFRMTAERSLGKCQAHRPPPRTKTISKLRDPDTRTCPGHLPGSRRPRGGERSRLFLSEMQARGGPQSAAPPEGHRLHQPAGTGSAPGSYHPGPLHRLRQGVSGVGARQRNDIVRRFEASDATVPLAGTSTGVSPPTAPTTSPE